MAGVPGVEATPARTSWSAWSCHPPSIMMRRFERADPGRQLHERDALVVNYAAAPSDSALDALCRVLP